MIRRLSLLLGCATLHLLAVGAFAAPAADPHAEHERWAAVLLDGKKIGWGVESESADEQGNVTSASRLHLRLDRAGDVLEMNISTTFLEAKDQTPLRMVSEQALGADAVIQTYTFVRGVAGDEVVHSTQSQGRTTTRQRPWPAGQWLTPVSVRRTIEDHLRAGDPEFSIRTLDPTTGLDPIVQTYRVQGPQDIEVLGKVVPAMKWSTTLSVMPGIVSNEYVDSKGRTLRTTMALGDMTLDLVAADKHIAQSPFDPPEMMARTLVSPGGVALQDPRRTASAVYVLTMEDWRDPKTPLPPSVGAQRVERAGDARVRVSVESGRGSDARADAAEARFLGSSTMIDATDDAVRQLTEAALAGAGPTPHDRAQAVRRAVAEHIQIATLGVGLATASEAVRTRRGDCTEFAVLLAACLRSAGIPSRVVSGVVFVREFAGKQGIFGYHMWAQAILPSPDGTPAWHDLDAAITSHDLPGIDATHIALSVSALDEGDTMESLALMVGPLGRLSIDVERAQVSPPAAPPAAH